MHCRLSPSTTHPGEGVVYRNVFLLAWLLGWFVCHPALLQAQDPELRFRHLSVEDGLSNGSVHSILQDRDGWMWFATEDGLNRYDGYQITVYRHEPSNANSLASSNFGKVHQGSDGMLWLGTWGGGLDRFDPTTDVFRNFRNDSGDPRSLSEDRVEFLFSDSYGVLWVGTDQQGVQRFVPESEDFVRYQHNPEAPLGLLSNRVRGMCEDAHGNLWLGSDDGLHRYDRERDLFVPVLRDAVPEGALSSQRIRALAADEEGFLWIGTRSHGLHRWHPQNGEMRHFRVGPPDGDGLSSNAITGLFLDSHKTLWIGTFDGGLNRLDTVSGRFSTYRFDPRDPDGLSHDRVEAFWEDRSGILWLGSRGGGLNILDLKAKGFTNTTYHPEEGVGLPAMSVRAVTQLPGDGATVWVGTDGGGLTRLDRTGGKVQIYRHRPGDTSGLANDRAYALLPVGENVLWIGNYDGGLHRAEVLGDAVRFTRFRRDRDDPSSLSSDRVQTLYQDAAGDLWIGTADGLNRLEQRAGSQAEFEVFHHRDGDQQSLSHGYVTTLLEDRNGTFWVGTRRGLNSLDRQADEVRRWEGLEDDNIQHLFEDRERVSTLWIGIEDGGLKRLDVATGTFRQYLKVDGLPSNVVFAIQQDDAGILWLSTSLGLSRFDVEAGSFRNYDVTDGLASHSFNRGATWRSAAGTLFFGSSGGLVAFRPQGISDNPHVPPVVLTSFKVFGEEVALPKPLSVTDAIELSYKDNFFSIEFAALDFTAPAKNRYAYRLRGIDADWVDSKGRTYANYTNLDPGRYTFEVKGSNNDGLWNEAPRVLLLSIRPPFWQTWWFQVGSAVFLGLGVFIAYQLRVRSMRQRNQQLEAINVQLEEQVVERLQAEAELAYKNDELQASNAELERFTYTVSHDLKAPLVTIKGFLGFLDQDLAQGKMDRARRDLQKISGAADKMQRLLGELLELSRIGRIVQPSEDIPLGELMTEATELLHGAIVQRGAKVVIETDLPHIWGDRLRLLQVLQNLLENAIKFLGPQEAPRIEIGARPSDHEDQAGVEVWVQDNGVGIDTEHHEVIFGLFDQLEPNGEGTGIGLTLVRRIVEVHGGHIWVESEAEGQGSTFRFWLPGAPVASEPSPP